ncbi:hypothetical protein pb186bvf_009602 [Paramecium bursaria]
MNQLKFVRQKSLENVSPLGRSFKQVPLKGKPIQQVLKSPISPIIKREQTDSQDYTRQSSKMRRIIDILDQQMVKHNKKEHRCSMVQLNNIQINSQYDSKKQVQSEHVSSQSQIPEEIRNLIMKRIKQLNHSQSDVEYIVEVLPICDLQTQVPFYPVQLNKNNRTILEEADEEAKITDRYMFENRIHKDTQQFQFPCIPKINTICSQLQTEKSVLITSNARRHDMEVQCDPPQEKLQGQTRLLHSIYEQKSKENMTPIRTDAQSQTKKAKTNLGLYSYQISYFSPTSVKNEDNQSNETIRLTQNTFQTPNNLAKRRVLSKITNDSRYFISDLYKSKDLLDPSDNQSQYMHLNDDRIYGTYDAIEAITHAKGRQNHRRVETKKIQSHHKKNSLNTSESSYAEHLKILQGRQNLKPTSYTSILSQKYKR